MKTTKGRLSTLPFIYRYFLKDTILISLTKEKISIFTDGTIKRTNSYSRTKRK